MDVVQETRSQDICTSNLSKELTSMKNQKNISKIRMKRLREQGYTTHSRSELSALAFGNSFAYKLCSAILAVGVFTANVPILSVMLGVAFLGFTLPNHPFDYIYNHLIASRWGKPELPKRSEQLKFACTLASIWIATTIFLFVENFDIGAYIFGGLLLVVAILVATIDLCIPSRIYNNLFLRK